MATEDMPTQLQAPQAMKSIFLGTFISSRGAMQDESREKEPEVKYRVTRQVESCILLQSIWGVPLHIVL